MLVEAAAISLCRHQPTGAASVAQAAVGSLGIELGDDEGTTLFGRPHRQQFWIGRPGVIVIQRNDVAVPTAGAEHFRPPQRLAMQPHPEKQMMRIVPADRLGHRDQIRFAGMLEESAAFRIGRRPPVSDATAGFCQPGLGSAVAGVGCRQREVAVEQLRRPG